MDKSNFLCGIWQNKRVRLLFRATVIAAALAIICSSLIIALPSLRGVIIRAAQVCLAHRELNAPVWHTRFIKWATKAIIAIAEVFAAITVLAVFFVLLCRLYRALSFVPSGEGISLIVFPKERFKKDWKVLAVIFCALFSLRIYYLSQKEGLSLDDLFSIVISNYGIYGWGGGDYDDDSTLTGAQVKQMMFCNELQLKDTVRTVLRLRRDTRDSPHTNFYYSLLRIFLTGMKDGGVKPIVHHAGLLNLLLFSLSFIFAYMLLSLFLRDEKNDLILFCTLAIMFLTIGSISNTMYFRPYQLQECVALLFAIVVGRIFCCLTDKEEAERLITVKNLTTISVVSVLFLLSAYASILLFAIAGVMLVSVSLQKKQYKAVFFLCLAACLTFVLAKCLYPNYFMGFFVYRGEETLKHIAEASFASLVIKPASFIAVECQKYLFYTPVIVLSAASLLLQLRIAPARGGGATPSVRICRYRGNVMGFVHCGSVAL